MHQAYESCEEEHDDHYYDRVHENLLPFYLLGNVDVYIDELGDLAIRVVGDLGSGYGVGGAVASVGSVLYADRLFDRSEVAENVAFGIF